MKRWLAMALVAVLCVLLGGCMYPKEMRQENQVATGEYVLVVQQAIDRYKAEKGVLPIKNSEETTPLYEKYPIDFKKLKGKYLSTIPVNAFENGGTASYVLIDAETKPTVKMMDLISFQLTMELQKAVDDYKLKKGNLPLGEQVAQGFYRIDFAKLNRQPVEAVSVYTRTLKLPLLLHDSGMVSIDYAPELMRLIDKKKLQDKLTAEQDLRELLVQDSYFVPARSYAFHWRNGQPVPVTAP